MKGTLELNMYTTRWGPRSYASVLDNGPVYRPRVGNERQGNLSGGQHDENGATRARHEGAELKKMAANKKAFFQMRLDLEGKRKNLGRGNILTFLINSNNGIEKQDVNKMLRCGGFQPAQVKGITFNVYRSNQVEVLFHDEVNVDIKEVEDKIKRDAQMDVMVGKFDHLEEYLMIYGLPLSSDMVCLRAQIEETIKPFVKKILDLEPTMHKDSATDDFFKDNFDGNWRIKVVPRNGKQIPNYIVVGESAQVMGKAVYTKKVGEKMEMCQDCFSTDHFKRSPECPGPVLWSKYCADFRDYWDSCTVETDGEDYDATNDGITGDTRQSSLNKELAKELENSDQQKEELQEKLKEAELKVKDLEDSEKQKQEKLKEAEEKAQDAMEKVKKMESELIATQEDNLELRDQLKESNKSCEQMEMQINEVENGVNNLERRMSTSLVGKESVVEIPETQTSVAASIEGTKGNSGSVVVIVNQKKRSLDSPEGDISSKKTGKLPEAGKRIWVANNDGTKTQYDVHSKTNSKVNLRNGDKLIVTKNLKDLPWGYIGQDDVFE